jgi:gliding motility-associated-like protein
VFTATDASGCVRSDTTVITGPSQLTANVPSVSQTNCSGTGTGTLLAGHTGGTGPFTFVWNSNPVQNDSILNGVTAGTYSVTVTDNGGCTATASGTLTVTAGGNTVVLGNPTITNVACFGGNTGSITATVSGGSGAYNYSWGPSATNANLIAGTYPLTVDDGAGCTASATYNVTQPALLALNAPAINNIGCVAGTTGSITANPAGGTIPYVYNWSAQSGGQTYTGQSISGLAVDNYLLTVTDSKGCSVTATYAITSVPALAFTQSQTNVTCFGGSNGTATIAVSSGTAPYAYNWNVAGPTTNATLSNVSAGTVNVTVTDANCSGTATFTLTQPSQMVITDLSQTDISCNGGSNGAIAVSVAGGTGAYTYAWSSNPVQNTATATNLPAGVFSLVVTDANLCTATKTYTLTEPAALTLALTPTNATCYQAPNGNIVASPNGGVLPYGYQWSDPDFQTTKTATGLLAGSYSCVVTDANGCTVTGASVIAEPADLQINTSVTAVKCIGDKNGTITVDATGGTQPYNFSATQDFTNFIFATNGVIQGLAIGTYNVLVADDSGCTKTVFATIPNATVDNFLTSADSTSCYGSDYNDGGAHIIPVSYLNSPFQYGIDGGVSQLSGDFYGLSAGPHVITATNMNGCVTEIPVLVLEPLPIVVDVVPDTVFLPLGQGQQVLVTYLNAAGDVTYSWTPELGLSCTDCPNPTVSPFTRQDYVITVSMVNGSATCYGSATLHANVTDPLPVYIPNSFTPNGDGNNDLFQLYGQSIKTVDLKIFNRWGELVYQTNNQFNGWDGTYKGALQTPQVFTYAVKVVFLDDKKLDRKGTVTLLR